MTDQQAPDGGALKSPSSSCFPRVGRDDWRGLCVSRCLELAGMRIPELLVSL